MFTFPTTFEEDAGKAAAGIQILLTSLLLDDLLILSRNFCITSMSQEWWYYTLEYLGQLYNVSCAYSVVKSPAILGLNPNQRLELDLGQQHHLQTYKHFTLCTDL